MTELTLVTRLHRPESSNRSELLVACHILRSALRQAAPCLFPPPESRLFLPLGCREAYLQCSRAPWLGLLPWRQALHNALQLSLLAPCSDADQQPSKPVYANAQEQMEAELDAALAADAAAAYGESNQPLAPHAAVGLGNLDNGLLRLSLPPTGFDADGDLPVLELRNDQASAAVLILASPDELALALKLSSSHCQLHS